MLFLVWFLLLTICSAFQIVPRALGRTISFNSLKLFDFDTSGVTSILKRSKNDSRIPIHELKEKIRNLTKGTANGVKASDEVRSEIVEVVTQLEKASIPSAKLTTSPLLDGKWYLAYTENDGSSAGKLGPFVGEVIQEVDLQSDLYVNYVRLPPFEGALTASWEVLAKNKWRVKFESIKFSIFGIKITEQSLTATGTWRFTYVDEDMRILYASGGKNTKKDNLFVLVK